MCFIHDLLLGLYTRMLVVYTCAHRIGPYAPITGYRLCLGLCLESVQALHDLYYLSYDIGSMVIDLVALAYEFFTRE